MDSMIYKIHPQDKEKSECAAEKVDLNLMNPIQTWSIGMDYSDYFVVDTYPGRTAGGSRLPAAKECVYECIRIVNGGDTPITGFKDKTQKIGKESEHCYEFDNVVGIAGKSLSRKNIMNYLRCVPRLSPDTWGQVGVWGQVDKYNPLDVPSKGSLCKMLCKNRIIH